MVFPNDIEQLGNYNLIEILDTKFLEYFSENNVNKRHVVSTQCVLSFVINGTKIIATNEGEIIANKDECILIGKGNSIMSERIPKKGEPYQNLLFFLSDGFIQRFYHKHQELIETGKGVKENHKLAKTQVDPFIRNLLLSALMIISNKQLHIRNILNLKLEEMLLYLIKSKHSQRFKTLLHQSIGERQISFRSVILNNINHSYQLEDYAHLTATSLSTFKRKFKEQFGESAGRYFRKLKLFASKSLLKTSDKTIEDIANQVGYESGSHYIRAFKKEFGTTPEQFRKSNT